GMFVTGRRCVGIKRFHHRFRGARSVPDPRHDARVTDEVDLPSIERLAYLLSGDLQAGDVPVWEVVWQLNRSAPLAPLEDKLRLARRAVSQLGDEYQLWRGTWLDGPVAPLTVQETRDLAADDAAW